MLLVVFWVCFTLLDELLCVNGSRGSLTKTTAPFRYFHKRTGDGIRIWNQKQTHIKNNVSHILTMLIGMAQQEDIDKQ